MAGAATSKLTFNDTTTNPVQASSITASTYANGGTGGAGTPGAVGGAALATIAVTGTGAVNANATANASAYAGTGGATSLPSGNGAAGGAATATAAGTTSSATQTATVNGRATGGTGGTGSGAGEAGGAGGTAAVTAVSATGYSAYARAAQGGGGGGAGNNGAAGGAGAASTLTNVVTGKTTGGRLTLYQAAGGGNGGSDRYGAGGAGGAGAASLTFNDLTANPVHASAINASDTGGGGAGGTGGGTSNGGVGGTALAATALTGAGAVYSNSRSVGGAGGRAYGAGTGGSGGAASGSASATSTATASRVYATVTVLGGAGGVAYSSGSGGGGGGATGATAIATDKAATGGQAGANATETGGYGGRDNGGVAGGVGGAVSKTTASASGFSAQATAIQTGGSGGGGAAGGAGASSTLTNAVTGATAGGSLLFNQTANGGAGGSGAGAGGTGGAAASKLTFNDSTANTIQAGYFHTAVHATGGNGGNGGNGAAGSGGTALATVATSGAGNLLASAYAIAGSSGSEANANGNGAAGAAATAAASAVTSSVTQGAQVRADATGGAAGSGGGAGGIGGAGGAATVTAVSVTDTHGVLAAPGATGSGTALSVTGTLTQVNTALMGLSDTDATAGADTIVVSASDGFGNHTAAASVAVTVNGLPVITAPASITIGATRVAAIPQLELAESGNTGGEIFTVTLSDSYGLLSAVGAGVYGPGSPLLTLTGSLTQIKTELATVTDVSSITLPDTITISAVDSLGSQSAPVSINVTVNGIPVFGGQADTSASDYTYVGPIVGSWDVASNWENTTTGADPAPLPPGSNDYVTIPQEAGGAEQVITGTGSSASLDVAGEVLFIGQFTTQTLAGGDVEVEGPGNTLVVAGALDAGVAAIDGGFIQAAQMTVFSLAVDGSSAVVIGAVEAATTGGVTIASGAVLQLDGSASIPVETVDDGTILADGENALYGPVSGIGRIEIASDASLQVLSPIVSGISVVFNGNRGNLTIGANSLNASLLFGPLITGFRSSDVIDFTGLVTSATYANGILTLSDGLIAVAKLALSGAYSNDTFLAVSLPGGDTQISLSGGGDTPTPPPGPLAPDSYLYVGPVAGSWDNAANWQDITTGADPAPLPPGSKDPVTIPAVSGGGEQIITGTGNSASLEVSGDTLLLGQFSTGSLVVKEAELSVAASSTVEVGGLGGVAPGTLTVDFGSSVTLQTASINAPAIVDNGLITVEADDVLDGSISGSGQIQIASGGSLDARASIGAGVTIAFDGGGGSLQIEAPALDPSLAFEPIISGFTDGNYIDFNNAVTSTSYAGGVLTLLDAETIVGKLNLSGPYTNVTFLTVPVGDGYTQISLAGAGDTPAPPPGPSTPDTYVWIGPVAGSWDLALNWDDVTAGEDPASLPPGSKNAVTITAASGGGEQIITGAGDSASLDLAGAILLLGKFSTGSLLLDGSALTIAASSTVEVGGAADAAAGALTIDAGAGLQIAGSASVSAATILDNGTILVDGLLTTFGMITGTGQMQIDSDASLDVQAPIGSGITVAFASEGTGGNLKIGANSLDGSLVFDPVIAGFATTNFIDFDGTVTSASYATGVLTLLDGAVTVAKLKLSGTYTNPTFLAVPTDAGYTQISLFPGSSLAPGVRLSVTVGQNQASAIPGLTLSETGDTSGEIFKVTLNDTNGRLSVTGPGVIDNGTTGLTITGTLSAVNQALASLSDTDAVTPSDLITLDATDSLGNYASQATVSVTVNALPVITAPASVAVALGRATPITGVNLSETGNTADETFTVILMDGSGLLGAAGAGVQNAGSQSLTISGSLKQVNTDLLTLTDTDSKTSADTIKITASDSLGNVAGTVSVPVTVSVSDVPVITAPGAAIVTLGQATPIAGISLAESGAVAGEVFTVTLTDTLGALSATGSETVGSGTSLLKLTGTLTDVNGALAGVSDNEGQLGTDTIVLQAMDGFGDTAAQQSIAVMVATPPPAITAPTAVTIGQNQAAPITGVSISETGSTAAEMFTVTVIDSNGKLSTAGTNVEGADSSELTITGDLNDVNMALATLTDMDSVAASDTILLHVTDSFGNTAMAETAVTVKPPLTPMISAPSSAMAGVGQPGVISGVSLSEVGSGAGETFTIMLTDLHGALSASGSGMSGRGGTTLTITGSITQLASDLMTLKYTSAILSADTITITATDSLGNRAAAVTVAVGVNGLPAITAPSTLIAGVGQPASLHGISIGESGSTADEIFAVTVSDANGLLSAPGTAVANNLTMTGSLTQVNTALTALVDTDANAQPDTITVSVVDGFGNVATPRSVAVIVNGPPVIAAPTSLSTGVGKSRLISQLGLSETGTTTGEVFTIILTDSHGLISATGIGIAGSDTTHLTLMGTLAQVDADLAMADVTDATTPSDTITIAASDSLGNAASRTIALAVNALPLITAPLVVAVGIGKTTDVSGISLSETGDTAGEIFTVTLSTGNGLLTAAGPGISGGSTGTLVVTGSLEGVNAALASLTDTDATAQSDKLKVSAVDGFGNTAITQSVLVTVNSLPGIVAPASVITGVGQLLSIHGVTVYEAGDTVGETFTLELTDSLGVLSATGAGVSDSGMPALSISGSLTQVNADLSTLQDFDATAAPDAITMAASDGFGNVSANKIIAVAVNGMPIIQAPGSVGIGLGQLSSISGITLSETGNTAGETFTVIVSDSAGLLAAPGTDVVGSATSTLTLNGLLSQVNTSLASLTDTDSSGQADAINLSVTDSRGNAGLSATIAVTVHKVPVIATPAAVTAGVGQTQAIGGISLAEVSTVVGENFVFTLLDAKGLLSATGAGVSGKGTNNLRLTGSLDQVNMALATLSDTDGTAGQDVITLAANDSFGDSTSGKVVVTVNGPPGIVAPAQVTIGVGQTASIPGLLLYEVGNTAGENFTLSIADSQGALSASGTGVSKTGSGAITITGSPTAVDAALATLQDTASTTAPGIITLLAKDSFGNSSPVKSVAIVVNGLPVLTAPAGLTVGFGEPHLISGIHLIEAGNTAGEVFTLTLTDTSGLLTATGLGVSGSGTSTLVVSGAIAQVNAILKTLSDTDSFQQSDTIKASASDSLGNAALPATIAVTVNGAPAVATPASVTATIGAPQPVSGVSVSESGNTDGETFSVSLADQFGALLAAGPGLLGSGTKAVTITGSLAAVNAALATLEDTDATAVPDAIAITVKDSLGNTASQSIAVTVDNRAVAEFENLDGVLSGAAGHYTINLGSVMQGAAPASVELGVLNAANDPADPLSGAFSVAGAGVFTNSGLASFSGLAAGSDVEGLDVALTTAMIGSFSETISLAATDTGASGSTTILAGQTLTITGQVIQAQSQTYNLGTFPVSIVAGAANDTFVAASDTLISPDHIDGGGGSNTLVLSGGGAFDLGAPAQLAEIQTVSAAEGQTTAGGLGSGVQTVYLRAGLSVTLDVTSGDPAAGNANPETIQIYGSNAASIINLGAGTDSVTLGSAAETVNGGGGTALITATGQTAGALIKGGTGSTTVEVTTGGRTVLNAGSNNLTVKLDVAGNLTLSGMSFVTAVGSAGGDTLSAMASGQVLTGGAGADTLIGYSGYGDVFRDSAAGLDGDTIKMFGGSDIIDVTDVNAAKAQALGYSGNVEAGILTVTDGVNTASINLIGNYTVTDFKLGTDGHSGSIIDFLVH